MLTGFLSLVQQRIWPSFKKNEKPLFLERKRGECSIQSLISQDVVLLELAPSAHGGVAEASLGQSLCSS
jgi:hypothetical protein